MTRPRNSCPEARSEIWPSDAKYTRHSLSPQSLARSLPGPEDLTGGPTKPPGGCTGIRTYDPMRKRWWPGVVMLMIASVPAAAAASD